MKAIIIDDEKHVREGLLLLADWKRFGIVEIFEARDGEEAKDIIVEKQPEIIFTDMNMPKIDGIDLLKWLHAENFGCKTIVISGYDDFHYMRNAIYYGSFDYILKPIEPDILNETIERAIKEWKREEIVRKSTLENSKVMNEVKPLYWDHIFSSIITKPRVPTHVIDRIKKEFGVDITSVQSVIAILSTHSINLENFNGDKDLALFSLLNICNEIIFTDQSGVCFRNVNEEDEIIVLCWKLADLPIVIEQIQRCIFTYYRMNITVAIGQISQHSQESYQTAFQTLIKHDLVGANGIVSSKDISFSPLLHLLDYTQNIMWALQSGSNEQVDEVLNGIFQTLQTEHILSLEQINVWEEQFELLRKNWVKEYEISEDNPYYSGLDYWNTDGTFSFEKFKEEKQKQFHELIDLLCKMKYQKGKNSIQEIESYISRNYEKDITLQDIAERFYLSREYISRKFKQEYKETITNYIAAIRIEKAKELLENPHLKIYEISFKVGYQNERYFSKVFKKSVGMTPNEYRFSIVKKE